MNQYNRHAVAELSEVMNAVLAHWDEYKPERFLLASNHAVGVSSLRMRTFGRAWRQGNLACVACGCQGLYFGVETFSRSKDQSMPHVNLYGIKDGNEVLFTHDHILARSLGGADNLSNSQVMCSPCNNEKSKGEMKLAEAIRAKKGEKHYANV